MVYDSLPDIHLEPSAHIAKHCNNAANGLDDLPLAGFSSQPTSVTSSTGLRKGFLSSSTAKPTRQRRASKPQGCDKSVIKPSKPIQQGPSIPDFLKLPLSEAEHKGLLHRDMLQEVMKPDVVTLGKMMEDSAIMEGFNDPAVMSAVAEIAQNPDAYSKHAAKVSKFYEGMGAVLAPKLQQAAAKVITKP